MTRTYFDSSALAKRYLVEHGSERVLRRCREAEEVVIAVIAVPELLSALNRLLREGALDARHYKTMKTNLAADVSQATIVEMTPAVVRTAIDCLERFTLRTLDALHLASALETNVGLFVSADHRQCQAARRLQLSVDEIQ